MPHDPVPQRRGRQSRRSRAPESALTSLRGGAVVVMARQRSADVGPEFLEHRAKHVVADEQARELDVAADIAIAGRVIQVRRIGSELAEFA